MGPPGNKLSHPPPPPPPQPFEIALVRKIESKTATPGSVRDAFLLLDIDGDGRISPDDVRTVLHNELGVDITGEQMDVLFLRANSSSSSNNNNANNKAGMGYADFARYFREVSGSSYPASQSGLAAAVGFERDEDGKYSKGGVDRERSIHYQDATVVHRRRHQLRRLLTSHTTRDHGMRMKATTLFLAMDVHRSGKVTMREFLDWLNSVGTLQWTMDDLRQVVLLRENNRDVDDNDDERTMMEREKLETRWFGGVASEDGGGGVEEAGMTEHDFAEFLDSLDGENE